MKVRFMSLVGGSVAMLLLGVSTGSASIILSDDFSTNTLSNYTNPSGGRTAFSYDTANQRVNGDATPNNADRTYAMAHNTSIGNFGTHPNIIVSVDFLTSSLTDNTATSNAAAVGVSTSTSGWYGTYTGFEAVVRKDGGASAAHHRLRIRRDGGSTDQLFQAAADAFTLNADTWYTLRYSITDLGGGSYAMDASVWTTDPTPTMVPGAQITGNISHSVLTSSSNLFAGLSIHNGRSATAYIRGSIAADNFLVVVPEPGTLSLLALGGLITLRRRRI